MVVLWINYPPTLIGIPLGNKRCHFDISECYPDSFILSASLNSLTKPFDFTKCLGFSISNGCVVWIGSRIDNRCAFVDNVQDISTDGFTWKINLQVVAIRNNNKQWQTMDKRPYLPCCMMRCYCLSQAAIKQSCHSNLIEKLHSTPWRTLPFSYRTLPFSLSFLP